MNTLPKSIAAALLGIAAVVAPARAEVNLFGSYVRTVITTSASVRNPRIWTVTHARFGRAPLNPRGDVAGDLFPAVAEDATQQRWPWVVWSHFNGTDYDLVWSRWSGDGWTAIAPLEADGNPADAVDPAIAMSSDGRPHAVWLSRAAGPATVELSIFLVSRWMAPLAISDPGEDAMNPAIAFLPDGHIQVSYDTIAAHVTKLISFARPLTITDELTPFPSVTVTSTFTAPPLSLKQ
jgi:hypothetical protein